MVQVGSKNAAFFMGRSIKVATKSAESQYVHELGIAAERLEQRYKGGEVMSLLKGLQKSCIYSTFLHQPQVVKLGLVCGVTV